MTDEQKQETTATVPVTGGNTTPSTPFLVPQDTVNKLVGQARSEGREKALADLLGELGVDSKETLTSMLKAEKERQEAAKTAEQKLQEELENKRKEADAYKEQILVMMTAQRLERRDNAVRQMLTDAHDEEAVIEWLKRDANKAALEAVMAQDGGVNKDAAKAAVEKARKEAAYLFKPRSPGSVSNAGGQLPSLDEAKRKAMSQPPKYGI